MNCKFCQSTLKIKHSNVRDFYFGSAGTWNLMQCQNESCAVTSPDPWPDPKTLSDAYRLYYTHTARSYGLSSRLQALVARLLYLGYAPNRLAVLFNRVPIVGLLLENILLATGGVRPVSGGVIVDVGCGSGERLDSLKGVGWKHVIGVESDEAAVAAGVEKGRYIKLGRADDLPFVDSSIDAVIMHHVIEHISDPHAALREIHRVLKATTGRLIVLTPNVKSDSFARFGAVWRGVEAPRHLYIYSVEALTQILTEFGFEVQLARTSARSASWIEEMALGILGHQRSNIRSLTRFWRADSAFRNGSLAVSKEARLDGDEIFLIATRALAPTEN